MRLSGSPPRFFSTGSFSTRRGFSTSPPMPLTYGKGAGPMCEVEIGLSPPFSTFLHLEMQGGEIQESRTPLALRLAVPQESRNSNSIWEAVASAAKAQVSGNQTVRFWPETPKPARFRPRQPQSPAQPTPPSPARARPFGSPAGKPRTRPCANGRDTGRASRRRSRARPGARRMIGGCRGS